MNNKGIEINKIDGQDAYYSDSWNSHSIYFYDPSGNVVEFIFRHNTIEESNGSFTIEDMKNISEIGIPAENVPAVSSMVQSKFNVEIYMDANEVFCPLGDEEGLFILSSLDRNWLGSSKKVEVFPLTISICSDVSSVERLLHYPYVIKQVS